MKPSLYAKIPQLVLTALIIVVGSISLIIIDSPDAPQSQTPIISKPIANITQEVLLHSTKDDCWTIINGELYDISNYIPLHPGGTSSIERACGTDATHLFKTKGGGSNDHSEFAYNLLSQMRIVQQNVTTIPSNSTTNTTTITNEDASPQNVTTECYKENEISPHNTQNDCWIIVNDNVYDVDGYIPLHPGGAARIVNECGGEATVAFKTKGGSSDHSNFAYSLLEDLTVGVLCAPETIPSITATLLSPSKDQVFPAGTTKVTITVSTNTDATCRWSSTDKSYGSMTKNFDSTGKKTHSVSITGLQDGDDGWAFVRCSQSDSNVMQKSIKATFSIQLPVVVDGTLTAEEVATHDTSSDCWIIVNNNVYDVSSYISVHPGGRSAITNTCGTDATTEFNTRGGTGSHSSFARNLLADYLVGALGTALPTITPITASITAPSASQQFDAGTTSVTLSVTTNVDATCRWSTSNQAYSSMQNTFSTTGGRTSHSTTITGLTDGVSRTIYVRCQESTDNVMTSSVSRSFSVKTPVQGSLTAEIVATHSTESDCWIIVNNNVYDVSSYISVHPGGRTAITNTCGTDATTEFTSRGGTGSHSSFANNLLAGYLLGTLGTTLPTVTPVTATITAPSASQQFDAGTTSVTLSVTTNVDATCRWSTSNQAYSSMTSTFSSTGGTSHSTSVSGLADGDSVTVYVRCSESADNVMSSSVSRSFSIRTPTSTTVTLTPQEVALHSSSTDCWIIVNNFVYDVTTYIPMHPGGRTRIINTCGTDATTAFVTRGGGGSHSNSAYALLENYNLGTLGSSSNQTGGGDTGGGSPTIPTIEEAIQEEYPGATIISINEEDDGRAEVKISYNGSTITVKLDAQHNIVDD